MLKYNTKQYHVIIMYFCPFWAFIFWDFLGTFSGIFPQHRSISNPSDK